MLLMDLEVKIGKTHLWENHTISKTEEHSNKKKNNRLLNKLKTEEAIISIREEFKEKSNRWEMKIEKFKEKYVKSEEKIVKSEEKTIASEEVNLKKKYKNNNTAKIKKWEEKTWGNLLFPTAISNSKEEHILDRARNSGNKETVIHLWEMIELEAREQPVKRVLNLHEFLLEIVTF